MSAIGDNRGLILGASAMPRPSNSPSPVVIRFGALGDMILLTPLLRRLHEHYMQPCVVIGSGPWCEPVYRGNPHVARVFTLGRHEPRPLRLSWWRARAALRCSDPGPIFVCEERRTASVHRLLAWSRIDSQRRRLIDLGSASEGTHEIDRLLSALQLPTPAASAAEAVPLIVVSEAERQRCRAWIQARGWSGRPLILVQPGNRRTMSSRRRRHRRLNRDDKAWPIAHWVQLLHGLHDAVPSAVLLLCGAPREAALLREIADAAPLEAVAIAALELRALFALCQHAHSMISIDTGPAHAAAALGLPLVVMFGGQPPSRWLPRSPGSLVRRVGGAPQALRVDQIAVETVLAAWLSLPWLPDDSSVELESPDRRAPAARRSQSTSIERQALNTESTEIASTRVTVGGPPRAMTAEPGGPPGSQTLGD